MSKKIRKYFLIGLLCLNLITISQPQVFAFNKKPSLQEQMELIQNDIKVDDLDIEPINTDDVKKKVVPDTKQEGKKVLLYFFKVMFFVAASAGLIYLALIFLRRYRNVFPDTEEEEENDPLLNLATPTNKQEAFMSFLSRTGF